MFIAMDENNNKIAAREAIKGEKYYCPICKEKVILKSGNFKVNHFAHKSGTLCIDTWNYDMSEWHIGWQEKYPVDNREVIIKRDNEIHRADVCIGNYVIEFQHSPISADDFKERNEFYNSCGYKVVWLFDMVDKVKDEKIVHCGIRGIERRIHEYNWKRASKALVSVLPQENTDVVICFQISEDADEIIHAISAEEWTGKGIADYSAFCASDNKVSVLTCGGLSALFKEIKDAIDAKQKEIEDKQKYDEFVNVLVEKKVYDSLVEYLSKENEYRIYPCFKDNNKRRSCTSDECIFCNYFIYTDSENACIYRFRNIDYNLLKYVYRDKNDYVYKIEYLDGKMCMFSEVRPLWRTLCELWKIYGDMEIARFININTNELVQLRSNPNIQMKKYRNIRGKIGSVDENGHWKKSRYGVIKNANKREWKMVWFKARN